MTQADLFSQVPLTPRQRGHRNAARAAQRTHAISPTWMETACAMVLTWGYQQSGPWLMEAARRAAEANGLRPPSEPRAWGAITLALKRAGQVRFVDYGPADSSNGSPKCRWEITR